MSGNERWRHLVPTSTVAVCLNCGNNPRKINSNTTDSEEVDVNKVRESLERRRQKIPPHLLNIERILNIDVWDLGPTGLEAVYSLIPWDNKRAFNKSTFIKFLRRYKVPHDVSYGLGIDLLEVPVIDDVNARTTVHLNFTEDGFVKVSMDGKDFEIRILFYESRYLYRRLVKYFSLPVLKCLIEADF
ncbi:hypothetical protein ACE38W_22345 [Chitinophaga sp. Hz27]|uniref:hypothetical protein n=1 Tax=Chitinophaga sp. Hz27 TaxID=3347169 RepID=UPI0035E39454